MLTRKFLSALGIEADKVDEIINAHVETMDGLKEELTKAKNEASTYKEAAEKLESVQKELDSLKADNEKNPYKVKYEAVKEEFEAFKNEQSAKATKEAKEKAYKALLKEAGVSEKRIDAVTRVADLEKIELDKEGKIKDSDKLVDSIKTEWSDFITETSAKGAETPKPYNASGKATKTKEEILQISDTEARQQAILENLDQFN